jgi:hypothetical protein
MQQTNSSFAQYDLDQLRIEHGHLEARLQKLDRHRSLSPEEQYEIQVIKKRKLAIKDQMRQLE